MKKIKHRMNLAFIFDVSNDSSKNSAKKNILVKVTHMVSNDFKLFSVILTKYITHVTYISHVTYIAHMIKLIF